MLAILEFQPKTRIFYCLGIAHLVLDKQVIKTLCLRTSVKKKKKKGVEDGGNNTVISLA